MRRLLSVILIQLLAVAWLLALYVLFGTSACTHPIEHLLAAPLAVLPPALLVTCRLSDSPHVRRWLMATATNRTWAAPAFTLQALVIRPAGAAHPSRKRR